MSEVLRGGFRGSVTSPSGIAFSRGIVHFRGRRMQPACPPASLPSCAVPSRYRIAGRSACHPVSNAAGLPLLVQQPLLHMRPLWTGRHLLSPAHACHHFLRVSAPCLPAHEALVHRQLPGDAPHWLNAPALVACCAACCSSSRQAALGGALHAAPPPPPIPRREHTHAQHAHTPPSPLCRAPAGTTSYRACCLSTSSSTCWPTSQSGWWERRRG